MKSVLSRRDKTMDIKKLHMYRISILSLFICLFLDFWGQGRITRPVRNSHNQQQSSQSNRSSSNDNNRENVFVSDADGFVNGFGYVDLGLPSKTLWATSNIGAKKPWEYGNYYAWGELTTKAVYSDKTNIYYYKDLPDISGDPRYDASISAMGKEWRMPTKDDYQELLDNCAWIWDKNGFKIIGPNGKSIYLPGANTTYKYEGQIPTCIYFTSTPSNEIWDNKRTTYRLYVLADYYSNISPYTRGEGCPIRAVTKVPGTNN